MTRSSAPDHSSETTPPQTFGLDGLTALVAHLVDTGHEVIAPTVIDGVIVLGPIDSVDALPLGWTDEQAGGRYRLLRRQDRARFGYAVGPQATKQMLHPPSEQVWTMSRAGDGTLTVELAEPDPVRLAFVGIRPCELAAMAVQDRVLVDGPHPDPAYGGRRAGVFTVVVDCGDPADTCFCSSMGTGPAAEAGYDLALTELVPTGDGAAEREPHYLVRVGSAAGADALAAIATEPASSADRVGADEVIDRARNAMGRAVETDGLRELLYERLESPRWAAIAQRCLSCGNCTAVCPTCFCTDLVDVTDLAGTTSTRWKRWDSCYSTEFSHLGPGPVRDSTASRYRQWFVHKLASWHDQFGQSGCVGCGRCITWCPVGIDLTAEVAALRAEGAAS